MEKQIIFYFFLGFSSLVSSDSAQTLDGEALIQEHYHDQVELMQSAITSTSKDWTKENGKVATFWFAVFFDLVWIMYKVILATRNVRVGPGCDMLAAILWYPLTVLVQGWVFKEASVDNIAEAVNSATQQITSIGYGSSGGETSHERLFHGLNAVASQLGPAGFLGWTYELVRDSLKRVMMRLTKADGAQVAGTVLLMVASLAAWTLFATDGYNGIDPWYATLISATTIGYGDLGPVSSDHKWMSAFILPLLTNAFAGWSNPDNEVPSVDKASLGDCGVDLDGWKDALFNPYLDLSRLELDKKYFKEVLDEIEKMKEKKEKGEDGKLKEKYPTWNFLKKKKQNEKENDLLPLSKKLKRMLLMLEKYEKYKRLLNSEAFSRNLEFTEPLNFPSLNEDQKKELTNLLVQLNHLVGNTELPVQDSKKK